MCRVGRHEASHLRHERDKGSLAQQRRLTSHVRSGDYHYLLLLRVEFYVVRNILLAHRKLRFDDRMASCLYLQQGVVSHDRTNITMLFRRLCEGKQTVYACNDIGIDLYLRHKLSHIRNQFVEETALKGENLLVRTHDFLLIFLQFLRDIALRIGKRLLANPFLWHGVLVSIAHLKVISEDVVISHFKRLDACPRRLFLLNLQQIVAASARNGAQLVQLL